VNITSSCLQIASLIPRLISCDCEVLWLSIPVASDLIRSDMLYMVQYRDSTWRCTFSRQHSGWGVRRSSTKKGLLLDGSRWSSIWRRSVSYASRPVMESRSSGIKRKRPLTTLFRSHMSKILSLCSPHRPHHRCHLGCRRTSAPSVSLRMAFYQKTACGRIHGSTHSGIMFFGSI
jgi:hypothetical protein